MKSSEWFETTVALVLAAVAIAIATFLSFQVSTGPGYATWPDKVSALARSVGLGPVLDYAENWIYAVNRPGDPLTYRR